MNNIDKQYQELLQDILDNGIEKGDRTGTGTKSVFGRMIRHNMSEGFPLLTTKNVHWKSVKSELLWFLSGSTDIRDLWKNGVSIWDGDWYKQYKKSCSSPYTLKELKKKVEEGSHSFHDSMFSLGPIYGHQWRDWGGECSNWEKHNGGLVEEGYELKSFVHTGLVKRKYIKGIDQIEGIIETLKTNPDSRRMIVSAWNVGELDEMTLPPCHDSFQFYTRELSPVEVMEQAKKDGLWEDGSNFDGEDIFSKNSDGQLFHEWLREKQSKFKTRAISIMWRQRSVDTFLGLPFNIASYALLLLMVADEVGMVPDELVGSLGDAHLYLNHIEQAKEQISREPRELPTVHVRDGIHCGYSDDDNGDIILMNYDPHPPIKAPLSN